LTYHTANLQSCILYIFQQIQVLNILNNVYILRFFSSKCRLFHNSNKLVACIIHILYTECAKIKKIRCQNVKQCIYDYNFIYFERFWYFNSLVVGSIPAGVIGIFHWYIILPIALWPWGRLSLQQKWVPGAFPGGKGGQCISLTTLPPSCAVVM